MEEDGCIRFLQIEYAQISSYHTNVITFRFTVFGIYLGALGILIKEGLELKSAVFSLILTIIVFILEMRNRTLSKTLEDRCRDIECLMDKKLGKWDKKPHFFNNLKYKKEKIGGRFLFWEIPNCPIYGKRKEGEKIEWFPSMKNEKFNDYDYVYFLLSHSFAIDFSLTLALFYSIYWIVRLLN